MEDGCLLSMTTSHNMESLMKILILTPPDMEIVEGTVEISELQVTKEDDLPIVQLLPLWFQEDPSRLQLRPETSIGKDIREES